MSTTSARSERCLILYAGLGFALGIALGVLLPLAVPLTSVLRFVVDMYGAVAPFILYFILAPSLLKLMQQNGGGGAWFSLYATVWFAKIRLLACLFAIVMVSIVFHLPLIGRAEQYDSTQIVSALGTFARTAVESHYFHAIYAAILTCLVLWRRGGWFVQKFTEIPDLIENVGVLLTRVVPLFTFFVGVYVSTLPQVLERTFQEHRGVTSGAVTILGLRFNSGRFSGIFATYVAVALLTGALCTLWQMSLLVYVKRRLPDFSIKAYFRDYFAKIYPLLWATSSEAIGAPLNMHLIKKHYPHITDVVRQFTTSAGSVFNVNGTLTCCFVMIPAVCMLLGLDVSVLSLLLCFPVIYIIGFGIPGIPGELILFAGPIMGMLGVPSALQPAFLMAFIGLQIGLPDSFRTGANSTDICPASLLLNEIYERDFKTRGVPAYPHGNPD